MIKDNADNQEFVTIEREPELAEWEHERIIIPTITITRMLELTGKNYPIALALYVFYYTTARRQRTNQPYALDQYCMDDRGLGWSKDRFYKAKKLLIKHGFIEVVQSRNADGTFGSPFIRVNYMSSSQSRNNQSLEKPESGFSDTNASKLRTKMLKDKKKELCISSRATPDPSVDSPQLSQETTPEEEEYQYLEDHPFSFSRRTIQNLLNEVKKGAGAYTLHHYTKWWREAYHDRGKESSPFAVIFKAIQRGWELGDYHEWGLEQAFG